MDFKFILKIKILNLILQLLHLIVLDRVSLTSGECRAKLEFPEVESPLFISSSAPSGSSFPLLETSNDPFFLFPNPSGTKVQNLTFENYQKIACPGKGNHFLSNKQKLDYLTCSNTDFIFNKVIEAKEVECKRRPRGCILHTNENCHGEDSGTLIVIGWKITENLFLPHITICWNSEKETTLYTKHIIYGQHLAKRIASPGRLSFKPGKLYSGDIKNVFKRKSQRKLYEKILNKNHTKILGTRGFYFARGHLAPDADFILPAEQDATYFFANVIPQFQKFNNGNWKKLEGAIRQLALARNSSLTIYTGTLHVLQMENENGSNVDMYLDPDNKLYPAPKIIWKLIQDKEMNEAVVVMGLNLIVNITEKLYEFYSLCESICASIDWGSWNKVSDWRRGAIICCSYDQFKYLVPNFPNFGRVNLLSYLT